MPDAGVQARNKNERNIVQLRATQRHVSKARATEDKKKSHSNARHRMEEKTLSGASAKVKGKRNGKGKDKHSKFVGDCTILDLKEPVRHRRFLQLPARSRKKDMKVEEEIDLLHQLALREETRKVKEKEKLRHILQMHAPQENSMNQHASISGREIAKKEPSVNTGMPSKILRLPAGMCCSVDHAHCAEHLSRLETHAHTREELTGREI